MPKECPSEKIDNWNFLIGEIGDVKKVNRMKDNPIKDGRILFENMIGARIIDEPIKIWINFLEFVELIFIVFFSRSV